MHVCPDVELCSSHVVVKEESLFQQRVTASVYLLLPTSSNTISSGHMPNLTVTVERPSGQTNFFVIAFTMVFSCSHYAISQYHRRLIIKKATIDKYFYYCTVAREYKSCHGKLVAWRSYERP